MAANTVILNKFIGTSLNSLLNTCYIIKEHNAITNSNAKSLRYRTSNCKLSRSRLSNKLRNCFYD